MTRCLCGHPIENRRHYMVRGKWLCATAACGCTEPRPDTRIQPQHRDDRHDELEPWRRVDMGAHRVDVWPEDEWDV